MSLEVMEVVGMGEKVLGRLPLLVGPRTLNFLPAQRDDR
jgi:hypothetical protein